MIIVKVPRLDTPAALAASHLPSLRKLDDSLSRHSPVVVFNARTGNRHPVWAELDSNATTDAKRMLLVRPAKNFREGQRYVVVLRRLKDASGARIKPPKHGVEPGLGRELRNAGIRRRGIYRAWSFTVASERSLAGRMLHIRDDAFAQLGDRNLRDLKVAGKSPQFSITSVTNFPSAQNSTIAREVLGKVTVPCYLTQACAPGGAFTFDTHGLPQRHGTTTADFICRIPRSALDPATPPQARPSLYGHGLLGNPDEVEAGNVSDMANEHNFVFCATAWAGFSDADLGNVLTSINDFSNFHTVADRMQQGFLNMLVLGRLMIHPDGLSSNAAFQKNGKSVIDTRRLFYDGNSQGGIMGGGLTAVAPDFNRAVLGVPGMNYSTLLQRSVDFEPYAEGKFSGAVCDLFPSPLNTVCNAAPGDTPLGLYDNYPNEIERPLIFSLMQMLWDRAEANRYAEHMTTNPLPNTPLHTVLMHAAFGDHQVANVAAEVEARTVGASIYQPALEPGRYWNPNGVFGIPAIPAFPFNGSALVYWDGGPLGVPGGTATPPNEDIPPRPPAYGSDPHSYPRNDVKARAQKSDFLQIGGVLNNYCTTANRPDPPSAALVPNTGTAIPCHSHGWLGP